MPANDSTTKAFHLLATRYLGGEASSAEREQLVRRLADPAWRIQFERLRETWEWAGRTGQVTVFDVDEAAHRLQVQLATGKIAPVAPAVTRSLRKFDWRLAMLAASLVLGATFLSVRYFASVGAPVSVVRRNFVQIRNAIGERSVMTLPDGTKVTLNSASSLSYPETFGSGTRLVKLSGEAFFEVTHDEKHPFVVESPHLRVAVLGTKFDVVSFDDSSTASVDLIQGRVRVSTHGGEGITAPRELVPGQRFSYAPATGQTRVRSIAPEAVMSWMEDRLILDAEPLSSVMNRLERRFGVTIELRDRALAEQTLTGRFEGESLERIFELLHLTGVIDYELVRVNNQITRVIVCSGPLTNKAPAQN